MDRPQFEVADVLAACTPAAPLVESFGIADIWNHLRTAAMQLGQRAAAFAVNPDARGSPWVNAKVTIFFGDVFVYLKTRNEANGGPIVGEVLDAFRRAEKARNATAPSRTQV